MARPLWPDWSSPIASAVSHDGSVIERSAGQKDVIVQPAKEGGTQEHRAPAELARKPCLTGTRVHKLLALAHRCDHVFPGAHDLEWAFERSALSLLQRRAITRVATLASRPAEARLQ